MAAFLTFATVLVGLGIAVAAPEVLLVKRRSVRIGQVAAGCAVLNAVPNAALISGYGITGRAAAGAWRGAG